MTLRFTNYRAMLRIDRCGSIVALIVCLGIGGCATSGLRGEGFRKAPSTAEADAARAPDQDVRFWGFSNKARDVERHMGATE